MKKNGKLLFLVAVVFVLVGGNYVFAEGGSEAAVSSDDGPVKLVYTSIRGRFDKANDAQENVHQYFIDKIGVDLQPITIASDQLQNQVNLMLSAGDHLDFISYQSMINAGRFLGGGAIQPVSEKMFAEYAPDYWKYMKSSVKDYIKLPSGLYYGIPNEHSMQVDYLWEVRKDWVEAWGNDYPDTIEELEDYWEFVKTSDLDKNGQDDTIPFVSWMWWAVQQATAPAYLPEGMGWWWSEEDGKLYPPEMHPNFKIMLARIASWYAKGYMYSEDFVENRNQKRELVAQNRVASSAGSWTTFLYSGYELLEEIIPASKAIPISFAPSTYSQGGLQGKVPFHSVHLITTTCERPDKVLELYNLISGTEEGYMTAWFGVEDEGWERTAPGKYSLLSPDGERTTKWQEAAYYLFYHPGGLARNDEDWNVPTRDDRLIFLMNEINDAIYSKSIFRPIDAYVAYDRSTWKSASKLGDIDTFMNEAGVGVVTGQRSIDDWDEIIEQWLAIGKALEIEDRTGQFLAWKATQE